MTKIVGHSEFETFDAMVRQIIKVPHAELKAKLEEEKQAKKRKKSKKSSASRETSGRA